MSNEIIDVQAVVDTVNTTAIEQQKQIFTISPSTLDTVEQCGMLYKLTKVDRLESIKSARPLGVGNLGHFMMHPFYFGQIVNPKDHHMAHPYARLIGLTRLELIQVVKQIGTLYSLSSDLTAEDRESTIERFVAYANFYHDEFTVLEVEQALTKILGETDKYILVFEAICDLVTWHHKLEKIMPHDHKWQGRDYGLPKTAHQITGTCWALDTDEFRINKVLERQENPFVREPFSYDPEQIEEWVVDAIRTSLMAIEYRSSNYYPRMRTNCGPSHARCFMYDVCKAIPSSRRAVIESQFRPRPEGEYNIFEKDREKIIQIMDMIFKAGG